MVQALYASPSREHSNVASACVDENENDALVEFDRSAGLPVTLIFGDDIATPPPDSPPYARPSGLIARLNAYNPTKSEPVLTTGVRIPDVYVC